MPSPVDQSDCTPAARIVAVVSCHSYRPHPMNRMIPHRSTAARSRTWATIAMGACSIAVAACGHSGAASQSLGEVHPTDTSATTAAGRRPSLLPAAAQIVSAWLSAQRAFDTAVLTSDPNEPALAATTVSPQLDWTRSLLERMRTADQIGRGTVQFGSAKVVAVKADLATVQSCERDGEIVVSAASGQPVPGMPGQVDFELFTSTMELTDSGWKLLTQSVEVAQCDGS
jgi:hypothetical protein